MSNMITRTSVYMSMNIPILELLSPENSFAIPYITGDGKYPSKLYESCAREFAIGLFSGSTLLKIIPYAKGIYIDPMQSKNQRRTVHSCHVFASGTNAPIAKSMIAMNKHTGRAFGSL